MPQPKIVFNSYVAEDRDYVTKISESLNNCNVMSLQLNLKVGTGGKPFDRIRIQELLKGAKHAIIILSKSYFNSEWHVAEFTALMASKMNARSDYVIPIIIDDCELPEYVERKECIDFSNSFDDGIKVLIAKLTGKRKAFVIMKIGDPDLDLVYNGTIKPIIKNYDYNVIRIDEIHDSEFITTRILEEIEKSDLIIADLSENRPNCYYEVGFAHALGREIIFTVNKKTVVHFDLAAYRFIVWESEHQLREELIKRLEFIKANV